MTATLRGLPALFLALCLVQQPVYAAEPTPPATSENAPGTQLNAADEVCAYQGKTNPPPGQTVRLIGDDEILLSYRNTTTSYLRNRLINESGGNLSVTTALSKDFSDSAKYPRLSKSSWLAAAAPDMTGDHKAELVTALRDSGDSLGAVAYPFTSSLKEAWENSDDRYDGGTFRDVDVAAGNLDRSKQTDGSSDFTDEVVVAFRDDFADIHLVALDGATDGTIANTDKIATADYFLDHHRRGDCGDVNHVAVATGDLNADGFDDEIVTVFKDDGNDLQVLVWRMTTSTFTMIYGYDSYSATPRFDNIANATDTFPNKRPVDVTTGDVDGDLEDEIVVAFRNGDAYASTIQLIVFDNTSTTQDATTLTMDYQAQKEFNISYGHPSGAYNDAYTANTVSLAAGDFDGDGMDEIGLGYNWMWFDRAHVDVEGQETHLVAFDYFAYKSPEWLKSCSSQTKSCIVQRSGRYWSSSVGLPPQYTVTIAAGDLDRNGKDEIALARPSPSTGDIEVRTFNADGGLSQRNSVTIDSGTDSVQDFWIAMGDQDGDSYWGAYTGNCYFKDEVALQSLIHAPPYWPQGSRSDNWFSDYRTGAGFGWELGAKQGNGFTSETSIGGSATKSGEIRGITGSLTRGWELSSSNSTTTMTTTVHGSGVDTLPRISVDPLLHEEPSYAAVQTIVMHYWCYDYTESKTNALGTVPVCVLNLPYSSSGASLAYWYKDGMTDYADTWVPVGMNLAEGRNANQPNSWIGTPGDENAQLAVDGNTNGNFNSGSVAATLNIQNPWWELDLGGLQWIDAVQIWNRTDCCTNQLRNFYVFVTKENAFPAGTPEELAASENVWFDHYVAGDAGRPTTVAVGGYGRRLRIQMATGTGTSFMNIAEVQIYGMPGTPDQWPKAAPIGTIASGSSFKVTWPGDRLQTVPGTLYYSWPAETTTLAVGRTDVDTPFHMGKGTSTENITESGASRERSIGLGLRSRDYDLTFGTGQKQSLVMGWDTTVDFNGLAQGFPASAPKSVEYEYAPYIWLQEAKSNGGLVQQFLVLDYFVPSSTPPPARGEQDGSALAGAQGQQALAETVAQIVPAAPFISSPTHPDPAAWYTSNTATFTWQQPADPAAQTYDWYLDRYPDSVPLGFHRGLAGTETYPNLEDGAWYLHVRAMSSSEDWSDASHRKIQVDANPPKVSLALDPPSPTGNDGWYVTPVNVTASADDGLGSGVVALEWSTDGTTWTPYTAAMAFTDDTPETKVYARARDQAGNVSEPVSTTFKIDRTAPDSHVAGGAGLGALVAEVRTNAAGNEELVIAGNSADSLSGRAGMVLGSQASDWNASAEIGLWHPLPDPAIGANWYYTATGELGAGYHIFTGRAMDVAGNQEGTFEIGRVLWLPKDSPDLGGSSVVALPRVVRPGEQVLFTLVARNAGYQEAYVSVVDTLPQGLTPEALPEGAAYDAASRTVTWPPKLIWPGRWQRYNLLARVDNGLGVTKLENQASFHASWPNIDLLPAEQRQQFLDREQTFLARTTVAVSPDLPAGADVTPPWAILLPPEKQVVDGSEVALRVLAPPDTERMYVREWAPDPTTGGWKVKQNSGWITFTSPYTWTLSSGQGVKYVAVWLMDGAGNISTMSEQSMIFVNRIDGSQVLADGQRVQYRGVILGGEWIEGSLSTLAGDPDLFVWGPRGAYWPDRSFNDASQAGKVEYYANQFPLEPGRYLIEVQAAGATEYGLSMKWLEDPWAFASAARLDAVGKERPQHPLVVSDPLGAGQLGPLPGQWSKVFLPALMKR